MRTKILTVIFFLVVAGLLIWQRFDVPTNVDVHIALERNSDKVVGDKVRRGEVIETGPGEYLILAVGNARVGLHENTTLELYRLFKDERVLKLYRGRIIVDNPDTDPLFVDTLATENMIQAGRATLINFDFLQTVHVIPLSNSVQTTITGTNEFLLLPVPIAVNEIDRQFQTIDFDVHHNVAENFYAWFDTGIVAR